MPPRISLHRTASTPILRVRSSPSAERCKRSRRCTTQFRRHQSFLANKQCLISGASRGIGRAIATQLSSLGASCILVGREATTLTSVRRSLEDAALNVQAPSEEGHTAPHRHHDIRVGDVSDRGFWDDIGSELVNILFYCSPGLPKSKPAMTDKAHREMWISWSTLPEWLILLSCWPLNQSWSTASSRQT